MIILINHEGKKFKQKTDETKKTNVLNIQTVFTAFHLQGELETSDTTWLSWVKF